MDVRAHEDVAAAAAVHTELGQADRKSTRLNSSHDQISYAVFCLKKKKDGGGGQEGHQRAGRRGGGEDSRQRQDGARRGRGPDAPPPSREPCPPDDPRLWF